MDELIAVLLVVDIFIRVLFWYIEGRKSPSLSSLEYHMSKGISGDEIIKAIKKHLNECSEETRRYVFEEFRKQRKINRSSTNNKKDED